jgi:hypothetical protein
MRFCSVLAFGMAYEFINDPPEPKPQASSSPGARAPVKGTVIDMLDFQEPTPPSPGLMRKRLPFPVWLLIALLLRGLIAAGLSLLGTRYHED